MPRFAAAKVYKICEIQHPQAEVGPAAGKKTYKRPCGLTILHARCWRKQWLIFTSLRERRALMSVQVLTMANTSKQEGNKPKSKYYYGHKLCQAGHHLSASAGEIKEARRTGCYPCPASFLSCGSMYAGYMSVNSLISSSVSPVARAIVPIGVWAACNLFIVSIFSLATPLSSASSMQFFRSRYDFRLSSYS